jgi:hypothetical protein
MPSLNKRPKWSRQHSRRWPCMASGKPRRLSKDQASAAKEKSFSFPRYTGRGKGGRGEEAAVCTLPASCTTDGFDGFDHTDH